MASQNFPLYFGSYAEANQYSNDVTVMPILTGTPILGEPSARVTIPGALCIQFA